MIPWVREKFAERRAKWISSRKRTNQEETGASADCGSSTSTAQPHPSSLKDRQNSLKSEKLFPKVNSTQNGKVEIRVISPNGQIFTTQTEVHRRLVDIKIEALVDFSSDSKAFPQFASDIHQLSRRYRLIRSDANGTKINEVLTLKDLRIGDHETLFLVPKRTLSHLAKHNEVTSRPTNEDIAELTDHVPCTGNQTQVEDLNEIFQQSNFQLDVRRLLVSLAQTSAILIGPGPHAACLITMLQQKLISKRKNRNDTLQCLLEMGFELERAEYALQLNGNVYSQALKWLIEHQTEERATENVEECTDEAPMTSLQSKPKTNIVDNTKALLEIVRIYSYRDNPPPPEVVRSLISMGFYENDVLNALKLSSNNKAVACEFLCRNREGQVEVDTSYALSEESPILKAVLDLPQVQMGLANPKMLIAFLSILENENTLRAWGGDNDTTSIITHILQKYHEEKHILVINQFHNPI